MGHKHNNVKTDSYRCRWTITNKHLWHVLNSYGCVPNKSLILKFPNYKIFKDKSLIRHFIRGYFDGDGCITHQDKLQTVPCISILGTYDILYHIRNLIFNDTNPFSKNSIENNKTLVLSRSGIKSVLFMYSIYYKSSIFLDRKYKKYLKYKNCRFKAKALKLLEDKIGEGWDINKELINDIKNGTIKF